METAHVANQGVARRTMFVCGKGERNLRATTDWLHVALGVSEHFENMET